MAFRRRRRGNFSKRYSRSYRSPYGGNRRKRRGRRIGGYSVSRGGVRL